MRVAIIGANGQLGTDLVAAFAGHTVLPLTRSDLDVTARDRVLPLLRDLAPHVIVNTTAFHRVDDAEVESAQAFAVNAVAVADLAAAATLLGARLVHYSTDYVFGGMKDAPYVETDCPDPVNVYGVSKAAGERLALQRNGTALVIRTSGLFGVAGASGKGGNFIETMLRLARSGKPIRVVRDQSLAPTPTSWVARITRELVDGRAFGLYHVVSRTGCSWYEFAAAIFDLCGLAPDFAPTTSAAFGAGAQRPAMSVLANARLEREGRTPPPTWQEGLEGYLRAKGHLAPLEAR